MHGMKVGFATDVGYCDSEALPDCCQYTHIASLICFIFHYCLKENIVIYVSGGLKREPFFVSLLATHTEAERETERQRQTEKERENIIHKVLYSHKSNLQRVLPYSVQWDKG